MIIYLIKLPVWLWILSFGCAPGDAVAAQRHRALWLGVAWAEGC